MDREPNRVLPTALITLPPSVAPPLADAEISSRTSSSTTTTEQVAKAYLVNDHDMEV
jgi:hypothetical protein